MGEQVVSEHRKQYMREYNHRRRMKDREATRKREYEHHKDWVKRNPQKVLEYNKKYRAEHPSVERAHTQANRHVPLATSCAKCHSIENLDRHHPDYTKPLEVVTLCKKCHKEEHMNQGLSCFLSSQKRGTTT